MQIRQREGGASRWVPGPADNTGSTHHGPEPAGPGRPERRCATPLLDSVFQGLASREARHAALRDLDGGAGLRVAAFAGLAPVLRESGQWRGNTHISKTGDSALRKVLYMPALCAKRYNPVIQVFWDRLQSNGKNGKAITCAAMRKLIHIAFGVIKSGKPFDPNYAI